MPDKDSIRRKVFGADDVNKAPVSVPEWGLETGLYVKSLNILDALAFDAAKAETDDTKCVALYLTFILCDEEGNRYFDPEKDVDELCKKRPDILVRIFKEGQKVNGLGGDEGDGEPGKSSPSPL